MCYRIDNYNHHHPWIDASKAFSERQSRRLLVCKMSCTFYRQLRCHKFQIMSYTKPSPKTKLHVTSISNVLDTNICSLLFYTWVMTNRCTHRLNLALPHQLWASPLGNYFVCSYIIYILWVKGQWNTFLSDLLSFYAAMRCKKERTI